MDEEKRLETGMARRRDVLGGAHVDRAAKNATPLNQEWLDFITRYAWGEVWTRPHYDTRTRRILVIGTMVALGRWEEFEMHVRVAIVKGGFTMEDIKESSSSRPSTAACRRRTTRSRSRGKCSTASPRGRDELETTKVAARSSRSFQHGLCATGSPYALVQSGSFFSDSGLCCSAFSSSLSFRRWRDGGDRGECPSTRARSLDRPSLRTGRMPFDCGRSLDGPRSGQVRMLS